MDVLTYFPVLILLTNSGLNRCDQQDCQLSIEVSHPRSLKVSKLVWERDIKRDWWQKCFHLCILVLLWQAIQQGRESWKNLLNHTWTSSRKKNSLWPATTECRENHNWSRVCMGQLVGNFMKQVVFLQPSPSAECLPMEMLNERCQRQWRTRRK